MDIEDVVEEAGSPASLTIDVNAAPGLRTPGVLESWQKGFGPRPEKQFFTASRGGKKLPEPLTKVSPIKLATGSEDEEARQAALRTQREKDVRELEEIGIIDMARAQFNSTAFATFVRSLANSFNGQADPNFRVPPEAYDGKTEAEAEELDDVSSEAELRYVLATQQVRREDARIAGAHGPMAAFAAGLLAYGPEGYVTGLPFTIANAYRAVGAIRAGQSASRLSTFGYSAAENVAANVALTGTQAIFDPYVTGADVALDAFMGLAFPAAAVPFQGRMIDRANLQAEAFRVAKQVVDRNMELFARAEANLPPGAPREAVQAEVARLEMEELQQHVHASTAIDPSRKLLPDEVVAEAIPGARAEGAAEPEVPSANMRIEQDGDAGRDYWRRYVYDDVFADMVPMLRDARNNLMSEYTDPKTGLFRKKIMFGSESNENLRVEIHGWADDDRSRVIVKGRDGQIRNVHVDRLDPDEVLRYDVDEDPEGAKMAEAFRHAISGNAIAIPGRSSWDTYIDIDAHQDRYWAHPNNIIRDETGKPMSGQEASVYNYSGHRGGQAGLDAIRGKDTVVVAAGESGKGITKEQVDYVNWLGKTFLGPDYTIVLANASGLGRTVGGDATKFGNKRTRIRFRPENADWQYVLTHEFGHIVLKNWLTAKNLPKGVQQGFKDLHAEFLRSYSNPDASELVPASSRDASIRGRAAMRAALERGGVQGYAAKTAFRDINNTPVGFTATLLDIMTGAFGKVVDDIAGDAHRGASTSPRFGAAYIPDFDEFAAEQFVKHIEAAAMDRLNWKPTSLPKAIKDYLVAKVKEFLDLFNFAKTNQLLDPDVRATEFFDSIRRRVKSDATRARREAEGLDPNRGAQVDRGIPAHAAPVEPPGLPIEAVPSTQAGAPPINGFVTTRSLAKLSGKDLQEFQSQDPLSIKYGLDLMPTENAAQQAEYKAVRALWEKVDLWQMDNPKDLNLQSKLYDTALFKNAAAIHGVMLRSNSPLARMLAAELMESPNAAGGRRATAAISKHITERRLTGNVINEFQSAYSQWRKRTGGKAINDYLDGNHMRQFNKLVAEEIESRRVGKETRADAEVIAAADRVEAAYERMRVEQINAKTVGWAALPETSRGYMPHKMSSMAVRNMTNAQQRVLLDVLVDQFQSIEGFDASFSVNLAMKYLDRVRTRALGGAEVPMNVHHTGAADIVEDALTAMGMDQQQVRQMMERYTRGGASHTKSRLKLDLLAEHANDDGSTFRLLDIFETDQLSLIRNQAGRVSGESALAQFGIMGKPGLDIVRRALAFGTDDGKAQPRELEAFDQMSAEFLHQPYGDAGSNRWMNRAMQATSLARLGGMAFTQLSETVNMAAAVGVGRTLSSVAGLARLRNEALALARGEKVNNPLLSSIEKFSGAEFGTDNRKMIFPMDNGSLEYEVFGRDSLTALDRLLRGGGYLQAKLSFWRAIHGAQQRGAAEQIVKKSMEYIRAGKNDVALRDMGISDELASRLRRDLSAMTTWEGDTLTGFDITKATDIQAANEFIQAVHRGTSQMIQDTFIGEKSNWAHRDLTRLLTQFRTFSITAVEKQWGRNKNNRGLAGAFGILMGSMSVAAPIYIARQYVNSIGRDDQEEFLEKALSPYEIGRATLNYVASAGLAGDFLDAFASVTGVGEAVGARQGGSKSAIGNLVAPSLGLVDDAYRAISNTKDGTSFDEAARVLPGNRIPYLVPIINSLD